MPRIISAIIAAQAMAANRKQGLAVPVTTSTTAMTSIGMQQAIIIPPCPPCPRSSAPSGAEGPGPPGARSLPYTGRGYETLRLWGVTKAAERGLAMNAADIVALAGSAAVLAGLGWFFFGPRKSRAAELAGGVQRIEVTVRGGYDPEVIRLRQGVPAELVFDRQESGDCTSRVVFPDLGVGAALPAFTRTAVRLAPARAGQFGFACGMNMIHGTLIVEPADNGEPAAAAASPDSPAGHVTARPSLDERTAAMEPPRPDVGQADEDAADAEAAQAAERHAEIADLSRRVIAGAALTLPVLFAVMASEVFKASWVPGALLNHWVQLALITPVMFYTGWPIHRTGWLTLAHRSADMNSLITLGTVAAYGYSLVVTLVPGLVPADVREVYFEAA